MIKKISIENFRGIKSLHDLQVSKCNIFIGDNGTSKTSILEAINHTFSPSFLAGRIKHTDFINGSDDPFSVFIEFDDSINAELPDGYNTQTITCDKIYLKVKKRDRKKPGRVLSDSFTVEHILGPDFPRDEKKEGWTTKRKNGNDFSFTARSLALSVIQTNELPRAFYYGKERDRQLLKGFNTSFSSVIEDLNWRYNRSIRKQSDEGGHELIIKIEELTSQIHLESDLEKTDIMKVLKGKLKNFDLDDINLSIIDAFQPYEASFFSTNKESLPLPVKNLGSGYEMIISLLFLETLASFSKERLLILIDEPELHLHPKLQVKLAEYLWELSVKDNGHQIFITTHSPIFYKNTLDKRGVKTFITGRDDQNEFTIEQLNMNSGLFPWSPSWGEINYFAYRYATVEFHNELYGFIQEKFNLSNEKEVDNFLERNGINKNKQWTREKNGKQQNTYSCTLPVFIRNKIHHPENTTMQSVNHTLEELETSINSMIKILN
ncbi:ATP-binding protein [bacterium]|nr:ATP-binding protein [bacterium]